jgi:hypothetical protein
LSLARSCMHAVCACNGECRCGHEWSAAAVPHNCRASLGGCGLQAHFPYCLKVCLLFTTVNLAMNTLTQLKIGSSNEARFPGNVESMPGAPPAQ